MFLFSFSTASNIVSSCLSKNNEDTLLFSVFERLSKRLAIYAVFVDYLYRFSKLFCGIFKIWVCVKLVIDLEIVQLLKL